MALPILGANTESAAYDIANSLRFDGSTSRIDREFSQDPTSRKTFTISIWVKRSKLGSNTTFFNASTTNNFYDQALMFDSNDTLRTINVASGSDAIQVITNRKFRDVAAWYHIVLAVDTTEAAVANGVKFYINGVQETSFGTTTYTQNATYELGRNGSTTAIGRQQLNGTQYFGGYMAEINYIDGQQLDPSYFGETNSKGVWTPIEYDGTYGNNGFYLEFKQTGTSQNSSGIGADTSGNDEHFAVSGVDAKDVCIDTPTNNFMTMNPLFTNSRGTFAEGNLMVTTDVQGSVPYGQVEFGGFAVNKGKWYYEAKINSVGSGGQLAIGWNERAESGGYINGHNNLGSNGNVWYGSSGKIQDGGTSNTTSPDSYTTNDVIGIACDFDNKKFYAHKNGTYQSNGSGTGNPSTGANGFTFNTHYNDYWTPWMSKDDTNNEATVEYNFGNPTFTVSSSEADDNGYGSFEYDVPTGYYSLCTKNLAEFG
jgi:hypothetical protein|tara:strand:+ start:212 stop:1657 length:1446 start_codon:yes stop_codon:yes gene_type:complete